MKTYHLTQQQLADKIGKERATVANIIRLLQLSKEVRNFVSKDELSLGQAKALLSVKDPLEQINLARMAVNKKLTVRAIEKLIQQKANKSQDKAMDDLDVSKRLMKGLSEELQKVMGTKVTIDYNGGKGKVSVHFYSDEELNQFVDQIRDSWQN